MVSTIAVGVDGSNTAGEAVKMAAEFARRLDAELVLLSAYKHAAGAASGHAEECSADILVVGNKGMHRRVLGSVPNTVTHKASCSVLIVKTT